MAEGPAEMRGIAKAVAIGDLRDRAMRLGRVGQIGPGPLQPALAHIMGEIVADAFEQLLQIALGNAFGLRDARRRKFGIVEPALDGLADPVQQRRLGGADAGVGRRRRAARARASGADRRGFARRPPIRRRSACPAFVRSRPACRENTSAKPPGATTRGSPSRGLPAMRPCSASDVTDSTIARMSRWNTTLQSPLSRQQQQMADRNDPMAGAAPAAPRRPRSATARSADRRSIAAAARCPAIPPTIRVSATPAALRCDAVAWPS